MGDETVLSSAPVVCHEGSYLQVEVGGRQNGVVLDLTVKGSPELVRLEFRVKPEWYWVGDSQVTKNGNSYTITGTAASIQGGSDPRVPPGKEQFKIDATCP
jgi:Mycobacterium 19 kDa lipoprotein antigen